MSEPHVQQDGILEFPFSKVVEYLRKQLSVNEDIPPWLKQLVSDAYWLSLQSEEGQNLIFTLGIIDADLKFVCSKPFEQPIPFSRGMIKKLALALTPATDCIRLALSPGSKASLTIVGFERRSWTGASFMGEKRAEIEVTKPGCLRLFYNGKTVVLERDRLFIPTAAERIWEALPQGYEDELATSALAPRNNSLQVGHHREAYKSTEWEKYQGDLYEIGRPVSRSIVCETIVSLVSALRAHHSGGILIFPESSFDLSSENLRTQLVDGAIFFKADDAHSQVFDLSRPYPMWNRGAMEVLSWQVHSQLAWDKEKTVLQEAPSGPSPFSWFKEARQSHADPARQLWDSDVQTMARLSQIDGAVIVNRRLEPVAFAAKLKSLPEGESLPKDCEDLLKSKGMRHRSTAIAVQRMGSGMGITISEDSDATLFSQQEGQELRGKVLDL